MREHLRTARGDTVSALVECRAQVKPRGPDAADAPLVSRAMKRAAQQQHVAAANALPATQPPKPFAEVLGGASKGAAANGGRVGGGKAVAAQRGGRQGAHSGLSVAAEEAVSGGEEEEDEDDEEGEQKKPGRRKITIQFINDKNKRHITFSKRKAGVIKKVRRSPSCVPLPLVLAARHASVWMTS